MDKEEIREWINTFVQILILIALVFGIIIGNQININLSDLKTQNAEIGNLNVTQSQILCPNGSHPAMIWKNDSIITKC